MKVQLKFKNKVYENYLIDENANIFNLNGNIQKTRQAQGRKYFRSGKVYELVMHSFLGYKEKMVIHHINENENDNRLENLVYLTRAEHISYHNANRNEETKKKISDAHKGKIFSKEHREKNIRCSERKYFCKRKNLD